MPSRDSSVAEQRDYSPQVAVFDSGSRDQTAPSSVAERRDETSSEDRPASGVRDIPEVGGSSPSGLSTSYAPQAQDRATPQSGRLSDASGPEGVTESPPPARDNLHRKWEVRLAEDHLCQTGVYLRRWRVETPWFSIRLHHWFSSDDDRSPHDHPWDFVTIPLRGSYLDESPAGSQRVRTGRVYYRRASHAHWVHLDRGPAWTLVLTGPKVRRWGFWVRDKWVRSYRYFYRFGNHPCDS